MAKKIGADGCHIGQRDICFRKARKILQQKIIGVTCHNSKKLIKKAIENKADYIAIGAFFPSKTKKTKFKANLGLLKYTKKITKIPIISIGGINLNNYKKLLLNKSNFLAISGYVWKNKKYKPRGYRKLNMKITANEIRVGMLLEYKNDLWEVLKTQHVNLVKVVLLHK